MEANENKEESEHDEKTNIGKPDVAVPVGGTSAHGGAGGG